MQFTSSVATRRPPMTACSSMRLCRGPTSGCAFGAQPNVRTSNPSVPVGVGRSGLGIVATARTGLLSFFPRRGGDAMSATAHARPVPLADTPGWALQLPFPPPGNVPAQNRFIPGQGFLLGRGEMVFDEAFDDPAMSPRHAEILRQGAEAVVRDLGGGIRVNGAIVLGSHALVEGDV